ncbi:MAG TPA: peptidoglycan DD-metalloendopeptidase family protein [Melioribacteraceae bacterium]|nr:peptidoglycan DD-metalloendopeptidase family protein [Melioribacteraceae bacterium]
MIIKLTGKISKIIFTTIIAALFLTGCSSEEVERKENPVNYNSFGLAVDSLIEVHGTIGGGETLGEILLPHGLSDKQIFEIAEEARGIFPVRNFKAGDEYYIYAEWDTTETVHYFVYIRNPIEYVVFDLRDSIKVYHGRKEVEIRERAFASTIKNSLWQTLESNSVDPEVAVKLSEIYAWQIDFFRIMANDSLKVVFQELYVDEKPTGVGKILTASFRHRNEDFYAFRFEKNDEAEYYDEKGNSLRKAFLKAPLKFSRISSRFSSRRFHPVLGRYKAHLGTDYAAPTGTPIMTVGDGVVIEAGYTGGNGNYVKVRHNSTYTTQYLHMSKFAKGIRSGVAVKQGQIIGYVGSTGLATGPHVCFRFWKNGRQVDALREKLPSSNPVAKEDLPQFQMVKDSLAEKLISNTLN